MRQVAQLRNSGRGEASRYAGFYLSAFAERRSVLANARAKFERLGDLAPAVRQAERSILFAHTKAAAELAVTTLDAYGIRGEVLDATMDIRERRTVFAGFEDGDHELVAAPRLLDEGVDVPAADLAIMLASNRSRRQMIQRLGRVLRKKEDGRLARIVVLFAEGTSEDPDLGAHEDFIDLIGVVAEDVLSIAANFRPLKGQDRREL
jgi:superfamily II DNA or RNA helicase